MNLNLKLIPKFFRVQQSFERPQVNDISGRVEKELAAICQEDLSGQSVAVTAGSRGIANIAEIIGACVQFLRQAGAEPFIVPAMGSHGGATAAGQVQVLASFGITAESMGCPIKSGMEVRHVCDAQQGFPVFFDQQAYGADRVLVVNRIKPHTRFAGAIESGLMKMMLIGLGKQQGAEVYHRVIHNHTFDEIVRSVAREVIQRCKILGGLAIMENAYEETADIRAVSAADIESSEPGFLAQVKEWMPRLPFEHSELLIVDQIGKNISGTGMDTNVIGRKRNDHAAIEGELPDIHHIYVRSLTEETQGNASGIGLAELCHRKALDQMDANYTRMNCITAGHVTGAMIPIDFESDFEALSTAAKLAGYVEPHEVTAMWIQDTLHLAEVECSEAFYEEALERAAKSDDFEVLGEPKPLAFDSHGDLRPVF
ncbi:MAG: [Fe-S]-binding protein [Pirellulaceae bacterium]